MKCHGTIKEGTVVLDRVADLPEGTRVEIAPVQSSPQAKGVGQRLLKFAGQARGLPPDAARNHDHYLHGCEKK